MLALLKKVIDFWKWSFHGIRRKKGRDILLSYWLWNRNWIKLISQEFAEIWTSAAKKLRIHQKQPILIFWGIWSIDNDKKDNFCANDYHALKSLILFYNLAFQKAFPSSLECFCSILLSIWKGKQLSYSTFFQLYQGDYHNYYSFIAFLIVFSGYQVLTTIFYFFNQVHHLICFWLKVVFLGEGYLTHLLMVWLWLNWLFHF